MPGDHTSHSLDASLAIPNRSNRFWPDSHARSSASALWLSRVTRWFSGEPPQIPRTWCSLRESPLMTWLPLSPSSTLVLWFNQDTVLDFILPFLPSCGSYLTPLATGSLEPSLLIFSTPGGLTSNDLHACSSPTPTRVKPQPAPAMLS
jgi:hypothetical protein